MKKVSIILTVLVAASLMVMLLHSSYIFSDGTDVTTNEHVSSIVNQGHIESKDEVSSSDQSNSNSLAIEDPINPSVKDNTSISDQLENDYGDMRNETSSASINSFLISGDGRRTLVTTSLEEFVPEELRTLISNLDFDENKNSLAYETEYKLERKLGDIPSMQNDTVRCSSTSCALLFKGEDRHSIIGALDLLSRDKEIGALVGGGFTRYIEADGDHYGMIVLVFKDDVPLTIR